MHFYQMIKKHTVSFVNIKLCRTLYYTILNPIFQYFYSKKLLLRIISPAATAKFLAFSTGYYIIDI